MSSVSKNTLARPSPDAENTMQEWQQRNAIDQLKLSLFQLTDFLNTFESSTKHKLATLNEKVDRLERQVTLSETALSGAVDYL